jgi:hypothetical protein
MTLGFNAGTHQRCLPPDLTPIARSFPIDSLPCALRRAALYVAKSKRVSTTIAGMTANGMLGLLTPNLARFQMPGDKGETRPATVYSHLIAPSASGKTRTLEAFSPVIDAYDKAMIALYEPAKRQFDLAHADWEDDRKAMRRKMKNLRASNGPWEHLQLALNDHDGDEPVAPVETRLLVSDITTRRFIDQLKGTGRAIGLVSDEADIVYENLPRLCRHLNRGFDGRFITLDRAGGESIICHDPRISVFLMVQNDIIDRFEFAHGKKMRSIGFWGRNLFGTAVKIVDSRYLADVIVSSDALDAYQAGLSSLASEIDRRRLQGITTLDVIELDDEALKCWRDFEAEMLRRMNSEGDIRDVGDLADIDDFASRAAEHAGRLATTWTVFIGERKISLETIKGAIDVVRFHLAEFQDRYSLFNAVPTVVLQAYALDKYLHRLWKNGHRSVPKGFIESNAKDDLRDVPNLDAALALLKRMTRVQLLPGPGRGLRIVHIPQPGMPFQFSR